jgi:parallel beta-helix repeat protein
MKRLVSALAILAAGAPLCAATLTVDDDGPADYNNIKAAVAAALPGDTIVLADGTYMGPNNRGIDFNGKAITLKSRNGPARCLIHCESKDRGFYFHRSESPMSVLEGVTILGGRTSSGGAVYCTSGASPTIRYCILRDNHAGSGGAIMCDYETSPAVDHCLIYANAADYGGGGIYGSYAAMTLTDCTISYNNTTGGSGGGIQCYGGSQVSVSGCTFTGNVAQSQGGAVYFSEVSPVFSNCVFTDNGAGYEAGAMSCQYGSSPFIQNCTFQGNKATSRGGGIVCAGDGTVTLLNSAFVSHTQHGVFREWGAAVTIVNCLFHDNQPGDFYDEQVGKVYTGGSQINGLSNLNAGNISGDPRFAFPGDTRLLAGSACIDAGLNNPARPLPPTDLDGNPRVLDGNGDGTAVVDIGAFERDVLRPSIALSTRAIEFVREADGTSPQPVSLLIQNGGAGTLDWRIDCNCPWLNVEPATGSEVRLSAVVDGTPQGIHQTLLTVSSFDAANSPQTVLVTLRVKGTLHVPDQFATIQAAISTAMDGETVEVGPGIYKEGLSLQKKVKLVGIDRPVIDANGAQLDTGVRLTADGCTVDGFQIIARMTGISVDSSDNTIANNLVTAGASGILLGYGKSRNTLLDNEIVGCGETGLALTYSANNTLRGNRVHDNLVNFTITASGTSGYENDIDTSNTVDGKPLYYLVGKHNVVIDEASNAGCIVAVNCTNLTISDVTLSHNQYGVLLVSTSGSRIERVVATDNSAAGISLQSASSNTLLGNTVRRCTYGIQLSQCTGNTLQKNVMTDNHYNFSCSGDSTSQYEHTVATSNTVDGKPIFYLVGAQKAGINRSTRAGCVFAINCSGILVQDLTFENNGTGVVFVNTVDSTIENVATVDNEQAGVVLRSCARDTVRQSRISANRDGVTIETSTDIRLESCSISCNQRGIWSAMSSLSIANCYVSANTDGGGILFDSGVNAEIMNCTIYGNSGLDSYLSSIYGEASGILSRYADREMTICNTIVWANQGGQISVIGMRSGTPSVTFCDVQGGYEGEGNIDAPPMLTPDGHLCLGSPCIGKGPRRGGFAAFDIDGEKRDGRQGTDIGGDEYIDSDGDGLPDWWELGYFGDATITAPDHDADDDGHTNLTEYEVFASDPTVPAAVYYVDADRPDDSNDGLSWDAAKRSIQAAVDLADNSDKIYIDPGLYPGNVTTCGKQIWIKGLDPDDDMVVAGTILSGTLTFGGGELPGCTVAGLTIANRSGTGIICSGSSPTIRNCRITANRAVDWQAGGGISLLNASPQIVRCTITGNISQRGAGLVCRSSSPTLRQCLIAGNISGGGYGGQGMAIYAEQSDLRVENCTIAHNVPTNQDIFYGSAIQCYKSTLSMTNSILWNRLPLQVESDELPVTVTYSDIYGGSAAIQRLAPGIGNITVDPCFVEAGSWDRYPGYIDSRWTDGDYHLRSAGWRWTPFISHGTNWVWDGQTSRCIDAGNPAAPLGDELVTAPADPDGEWGWNLRINMGAYGGTREASMAPPGWALLTDLDNDGKVNLRDFNRLAGLYRATGKNTAGDVTRDSRVNYADLTLLADAWLQKTTWAR